MKELEGWNRIEVEWDLVEDELMTKRNCRAQLWDCLRLEEVEWRQTSRGLWLKEGTKYNFFSSLCQHLKIG